MMDWNDVFFLFLGVSCILTGIHYLIKTLKVAKKQNRKAISMMTLAVILLVLILIILLIGFGFVDVRIGSMEWGNWS